MDREEVERVVLRQLELDGNKFKIDLDSVIDELRTSDLVCSKYKYSEIYSKMIVPEWMLKYTEEAKEEESSL
jgi:predicted nucleic-acid-binding Zn-ribbon protein